MSAALAQHQHWLVQAITGLRPPRSLTRLGGSAMAVDTGLGVYRHAYRARLQECLRDDFPALASLLGDTGFAAVADAVITAHLPRDATLNLYGRQVPLWLRRHSTEVAVGRLAWDLARLEWALVEAIHAPLAPVITPQDLATVPADGWDGVVLEAAPSLRRIASRWPIDVCYRQHLRGEVVTVPAVDPGTTVVLRGPNGLARHVLAPREGRLLGLLVRGRSLGAAVAACPLAPAELDQAFRRFIANGFFTRIRQADQESS